MTGFAVSTGDLQALDAFLASAGREAAGAVERLRAEADSLFGSGWHGPAASAFRLAWEQWLDGARIVLAALDETASLLGASAASYSRTDDAVRAAAAGGAP